MNLPQLSAEQRSAASAKATAARATRAQVKEALRLGTTTLADVVGAADDDEALARMRVSDLLQAMPGVGPVRAESIMSRLAIAESRRLRGLGAHQRAALMAEFESE